MKTLIVSVMFFLSLLAIADMPQHYTPWPANGTLYLKDCPGECYPLVENGVLKDIEILSLADVQVDDPSKPIYGKEEIELCESEDACKLLVAEKKCQLLNFHPIYVALEDGSFEAYCTGIDGYRPMTVKRLQEDSVKKAAKVARLAAEKDVEDSKKVQRKALKDRLKALSEQADLTAGESREAILKLLKAKALSGEI